MTTLSDRIDSLEQGFSVEALGLRLFDEDISRTRWAEIGQFIRTRVEGSAWALADWLIAGARTDRNWTGGSTYEKAAEVTGYSKAHLSNAYRTGIAFPWNRRRPTLSYSVHRESLRLPEELRGAALDRAELERWSADDMVDYINRLIESQQDKTKADIAALIKRPAHTYYSSPQVRCPNCQHAFPIKGHKVNQEDRHG